jgi:hypothetical protein
MEGSTSEGHSSKCFASFSFSREPVKSRSPALEFSSASGPFLYSGFIYSFPAKPQILEF